MNFNVGIDSGEKFLLSICVWRGSRSERVSYVKDRMGTRNWRVATLWREAEMVVPGAKVFWKKPAKEASRVIA